MQSDFIIRAARAEELIELRHRILRADLPRSEAIFACDADPTSFHVAAELQGKIVGCATIQQDPYHGNPAWRLRGMAVDDHVRRRGVGQAVLQLIYQSVERSDYSHFLWANARCPAIPFYLSEGWIIVSDVFEIPTAGPHVVMIRPAR